MTSLFEQSVLVVDAQATGANPTHGALVELGWAQVRAGEGDDEPPRVESYVVGLPPDTVMSPRVRKITGIGDDE